MSAKGTFERDLERWLDDRAPGRAPAGLHVTIVERVRTSRQRPPWLVSLRGGTFPGATRAITRPAVRGAYLLVVLGLLVAFVAGAIAAGALRSQPSRPAAWTATGSMAVPRAGATATLLRDGRVLVAGGDAADGTGLGRSAELYDPATGSWTATGQMTTARIGHTATLLSDGKVLVTGGDPRASSELYDPANGTWTATGRTITARRDAAAALLLDGRVLVVGGDGFDASCCREWASAELYDPASGTWSAAARMIGAVGAGARAGATTTVLRDGRVLVAGDGPTELYDPTTGSWAATAPMGEARSDAMAVRLDDGRVLVAAGGPIDAEVYDPASGTWTLTGPMLQARRGATATLLPDGKVLVVGGGMGWGGQLSVAESYDPGSETWSPAGVMADARWDHAATLLSDGRVLVAGGADNNGGALLASAELYDPGGP